MFRPTSIFYANRKVRYLREQLAHVQQPIAEDVARKIVAQAWGWQSWGELLSALEAPGEPSPLDEELVGADARANAMALINEKAVARRTNSACAAIRRVGGLPGPLAGLLAQFVRLTGRHSKGTWLTPEEYREMHAGFTAPRSDWTQDILDCGRQMRDKPPGPLPPHRPR